MEFDYILACGDSFTEGCQNIIKKGPEGTWPGMVAKYFDVPFDNIALGGSSNTIISYQPVRRHKEISENLTNAKNPLLIFGFTMHGRLTYFNPRVGNIESYYTLDPQHISENAHPFVHAHKDYLHLLLQEEFPNNLEKWKTEQYVNDDEDWLDSLTHATRTAIQTANAYKKLIPNCNVLWGFIHEACELQGFGDDIFQIVNTLEGYIPNVSQIRTIEYPHIDTCFNSYYDWKPLQRVMGHTNDYIIGDGDGHPNIKGIELIAEQFIKGITGKVS